MIARLICYLHICEGVPRPTVDTLNLFVECRVVVGPVVVASLFHVIFIAVLANLHTNKGAIKCQKDCYTKDKVFI